jgi:putative transcriptional regulator
MSVIGKSLLKGAKQALAHAKKQKVIGTKIHKVKIPLQVDVRAIRNKLHLTRNEFADRYGFNPRTLEKWEQGMRKPDGAVRAYLMVIAKNPRAVENALSSTKRYY